MTMSTVTQQPDLFSPVETDYSGYHFRSCLEAQWAVFFNTLGVRWEYPGFTLRCRGHYLPDFWLPRQQCWIDIKTEHPNEKQLLQAADLSFAIHKCVALVWGSIGKHHIYLFYPPLFEAGYYKRYVFSLCSHCQNLLLACPPRKGNPQEIAGYCQTCQEMIVQDANTFISHPRLLAAYSTARRAHFISKVPH